MSDNRDEIIAQMQREADLAQAIHEAPGGPEKWIGHVVKKGFIQTADPKINKEWMWVKIEGVEGGRLFGTLRNQPYFATYLNRGDRGLLEENEIVAVAK